jgi:hypothetical protein
VTRRLAVEVAGTAIICAAIAALHHIAAWWNQPWATIKHVDGGAQ